jgi:MFS superfamily sulfate permease-like transporter
MDSAAKRGTWLFYTLRDFKATWLAGDATAALILAAIAIPEQLATAKLAGMAPMTGLFAFAAGTVAFAAFGANRYLSVGADSTIAPIFASSLAVIAAANSVPYPTSAAILALLIGFALVAAGLLRAGWIADLLSVPVTTGFLAGISVHVIIGQLPALLGIDVPQGPLIGRVAEIVRQLPQAHLYPLAIGAGVVAISTLAERFSARIPGALIGLVVAGAIVWLFALDKRGVAMMTTLPVALPPLALAVPNWGEFTQLLPLALTVALVCAMQTAVVVRSFPTDPDGREELSGDFIAVGAGNILAAALGAFAVNSSPPRTAAVAESGGRSQLSGLLALALVAAIVLLAAGAFALVPEAALSGVLVFVGMRIFRVRAMEQIYRHGGWEILLVAASAVFVMAFSIQTGVTMSIVLALLHGMYIVARPKTAVLARIPGTTVWWPWVTGQAGEHEPGVLVFAPFAPINFTNAGYVRRRLMESIAAMPEPCRLVVIEANGIIDIDFTGAEVIRRLIEDLRKQKIDVSLARLESERAERSAARTGLLETLGADHVFRSVEDAIRGT